jgi:hypothetical protein
MKATVKKNKGNYTFDLSIKGLTSGQLVCIQNSLNNWKHEGPSAIAADLLEFLQASFKDSNLPELLVDFPPTNDDDPAQV